MSWRALKFSEEQLYHDGLHRFKFSIRRQKFRDWRFGTCCLLHFWHLLSASYVALLSNLTKLTDNGQNDCIQGEFWGYFFKINSLVHLTKDWQKQSIVNDRQKNLHHNRVLCFQQFSPFCQLHYDLRAGRHLSDHVIICFVIYGLGAHRLVVCTPGVPYILVEQTHMA